MVKSRAIFSLLFVSLCFCSAAVGADLKMQKAPSSDVSPTVQLSIETVIVKQQASRKLGSKLTSIQMSQAKADLVKGGPVRKIDLVCSIAVYYDPEHTMRVQDNIYHTGSLGPTRPGPFGIYFIVGVKNTGLITTATNVTNQANFIGAGLFQTSSITTAPADNFSPGETIEYDFYYRPVAMGTNNKIIHVIGRADFPNSNAEDNESNNQCNYTLTLKYP